MTTPRPTQPIGVFDSGVGGLSVLQALRLELPHENIIYVADAGFAPYGERAPDFVLARARHISAHLLQREPMPIKALVVACNTATAAAIHWLRQDWPNLPIVGVEPALKPAIAASRTKRIGVMATRTTLNSAKFQNLLATLAHQAEFICQPCDGLAHAIECADAATISALCQRYSQAIGQFGRATGQIDTLVLGCTHYPFASATLRRLLPAEVQLIDNGASVARQTRRIAKPAANCGQAGQIKLLSSGQTELLSQATQRWLGLHIQAQRLPT